MYIHNELLHTLREKGNYGVCWKMVELKITVLSEKVSPTKTSIMFSLISGS
jgi:hypothetical protein